MIFLDTHVLVFLATDASLLPKSLWRTLDSEVLVYSPMAKLELGFLYEINRIHP